MSFDTSSFSRSSRHTTRIRAETASGMRRGTRQARRLATRTIAPTTLMAPGDPAPRRLLRVTVSDENGRPVVAELGSWLAKAAPSTARGSVHIALVTDRQVHDLNRRYRRRNHATDVL